MNIDALEVTCGLEVSCKEYANRIEVAQEMMEDISFKKYQLEK